MRSSDTRQPAGAGLTFDRSAELAGELATAEAAAVVGRERVRGVLLCASGYRGNAVGDVCRGAASVVPGAAIASLAGDGVAAPHGEIEGERAVSALAWSVGTRFLLVGDAEDRNFDEHAAVARLHQELAGAGEGASLLFGEPRRLNDGFLRDLAAGVPGGLEMGAATRTRQPLAVHTPERGVREGAMLMMCLARGYRLVTGASAAMRPLSPSQPITRMQGPFIVGVGDRAPLDLLEEEIEAHGDISFLAALIAPRDADRQRPGHYLARPIAGLDPSSRGVHIKGVAVGDRIAFAVRDPAYARQDMRAMLRAVSRRCGGGSPFAGILLTSSDRGYGLYGAANVDSQAVRSSFPSVPFCGLQSSAQIVRFDDLPRQCVGSAVLGLLCAPS